MAKKSSIEKQKRRERLVGKYRKERERLKALVRDLTLDWEKKSQAQRELNKMPRNASRVRLRNRCQITGRARGYLRKFNMSRLCFREAMHQGLIPGGVKASW